MVIYNFYQDLFIIASDRTDAVINHARQLGIVVTRLSKRSHYGVKKKKGRTVGLQIIILVLKLEFAIHFHSNNDASIVSSSPK